MGKLALGLPFFIKKDLLHIFVTCAGLEGFESTTMAIFKIIIQIIPRHPEFVCSRFGQSFSSEQAKGLQIMLPR